MPGSESRLPFRAVRGDERRFIPPRDTGPGAGRAADGAWTVTFTEEDGATDRARAEFVQTGERVTGTFLTPTGDYRFLDHYEFLAEGRMLSMSDIDERRVGALLAVSRYLGDHLKIGVGYNFADFSEDLTDLSYDHQGVFLNITGSM